MGGAFGVGVLTLIALLPFLGPIPLALMAVGLLIGGAILQRRGLVQFFGPVLISDLIRTTRRNRYFVLRFFYAGVLLLTLCWQYSEQDVLWRSTVQPKQMAVFASQFFNKFMTVQFFFALVLTPAYAATAIAEEKDRKTLEYLLATDLLNHEIVLSKLVSRVANLALIIATGLPILALVLFLGGVDPQLVFAGFVATGALVIGLSSVGILFSVYARKPRNAILLTYLATFAYVGLGYLLAWALDYAALNNVKIVGAKNPVTWGDLADWINAGNLPVVLFGLAKTARQATIPTAAVAGALSGFLIFHAVLAVACTTWAIARLRALALQQGPAAPEIALQFRHHYRPALRRLPMVWKELFVEPGFRLSKLGGMVMCVLVVLSLLPAAWIWMQYIEGSPPMFGGFVYQSPSRSGARMVMINGTYASLGGHLNWWIRWASMSIASLMLLGVALRASTSVSGERDRDTMDALLTSPLQSHDILFAKWLGSLLSVRWVWLWIGVIWAIGLATDGLHILAIPLFVIAWLVYASAFIAIGLWFSTACRTTLRATLSTLVVCTCIGAGQYAACMFCLPLGSVTFSGGEIFWLQSALTPPAVLHWLAAGTDDLGKSVEWDLKTLSALIGLIFWAFISLFLWTITRSRFRRMTARMPYHRPDAADQESLDDSSDEPVEVFPRIGAPKRRR